MLMHDNVINTKRHRRSIPAALAAIATIGAGSEAVAGEGYNVGDTFPGFTATTLQGDSFTFADVSGKFVLIDFCTIWCPPCQSMAPDADDVSDALNASGIDFVYVQALMEDSSGLPADEVDAAAWASALSVLSPPVIILHPDAVFDSPMLQAFVAFNSNSVPTLVMLDPEGVILDISAGALNQAQLIAHIESLVDDPAPCPADVNDDSVVNVTDLLNLLAAWGSCEEECEADIDGNSQVNVADLLALLAAWGPCP